MSCNPTYTTEYLPIGSTGCQQSCRGCTFNAVVATSCTEDSCHFSWTVTRTGCASQPDDEFTGNATLAAGTTRQVDFYCDPAESCARFRISLGCTANASAPQPHE